jgi:hypothetical protein
MSPVLTTIGASSSRGFGRGGGPPFGEAIFDAKVGANYNWTVPAGVKSICILCVGGGGGGRSRYSIGSGTRSGGGGGGGALAYRNDVAVTPGQTLVINVGDSGQYGQLSEGAPGGNSSVSGTGIATIIAGGGSGSSSTGGVNAPGGSPGGTYDGGGSGGTGGQGGTTSSGGGGGGAGGYSGNGGAGGTSTGSPSSGQNGNGGGGGGGGQSGNKALGGGGVGIFGQGSNGIGQGGTSGHGGGGSFADVGISFYGTTGLDASDSFGGKVGGGGGGKSNTAQAPAYGSAGGKGIVRIMWGVGRSFPFNAAFSSRGYQGVWGENAPL